MFRAVWKYAFDVDCMSIVCGAIVMMRDEPAFEERDLNACVM